MHETALPCDISVEECRLQIILLTYLLVHSLGCVGTTAVTDWIIDCGVH